MDKPIGSMGLAEAALMTELYLGLRGCALGLVLESWLPECHFIVFIV